MVPDTDEMSASKIMESIWSMRSSRVNQASSSLLVTKQQIVASENDTRQEVLLEAGTLNSTLFFYNVKALRSEGLFRV